MYLSAVKILRHDDSQSSKMYTLSSSHFCLSHQKCVVGLSVHTQCDLMHYSVVRSKSAMSSLFIGNSTTWGQLLPANNRQNVILHIIGSLWGESFGGPGSLHKGPVMRKTFPCQRVFLLNNAALKLSVLWGRAHAGGFYNSQPEQSAPHIASFILRATIYLHTAGEFNWALYNSDTPM